MSSTIAFSQARRVQLNPNYDSKIFRMGMSIGFSSLNYRLVPASSVFSFSASDSVLSVSQKGRVAINLNIISNLKLHDNLSLRFLPGIIIGQREINYLMRDFTKQATPENIPAYIYNMQISSVFIDLPLYLKFSANRINNYRPYIIAGISTKYDLDTYRVVKNSDEYIITQDPLDFFYEFGFGIDWYLLYFKLCTEFKFAFGIKNILQQDNIAYTTSIDRLYTKFLVFTLNFE